MGRAARQTLGIHVVERGFRLPRGCSHLSQLDEIDWQAIETRRWQSCKDEKQAEFLIEHSFLVVIGSENRRLILQRSRSGSSASFRTHLLKYRKALYGPYAENLRHVLNAVEGHFVSGYADGGDQPDKPLDPIPGAIEDAHAVLERNPDTRARFDRVTALVDGFESSFGLELLATVHWVVTHESVQKRDDVVERTYAWNERKKRFSPRQIGIAIDRLHGEGWIDDVPA